MRFHARLVLAVVAASSHSFEAAQAFVEVHRPRGDRHARGLTAAFAGGQSGSASRGASKRFGMTRLFASSDDDDDDEEEEGGGPLAKGVDSVSWLPTVLGRKGDNMPISDVKEVSSGGDHPSHCCTLSLDF